MVGVLVATAGILGFVGYEVFAALKPFRREPVWEKLDENSTTETGEPKEIGAVACGSAESKVGVLLAGITAEFSSQDAGERQTSEERGHDRWNGSNYCWVVICKNHHFHHKQSHFYAHKIPLAETDSFETLPVFATRLIVRCDECGKEYVYKPSEVLRYEVDASPAFVPHPLFRELANGN